MEKLHKIRDFLCKIPNINSGGCAIAAYVMYIEATRLGLKAQIVYLYEWETNLRRNRIALGDPAYPVDGCDHAVLEMDNIMFDCLETVSRGAYLYRQDVTPEFTLKTIREYPGWECRYFNRSKALRNIKKHFNIKI